MTGINFFSFLLQDQESEFNNDDDTDFHHSGTDMSVVASENESTQLNWNMGPYLKEVLAKFQEGESILIKQEHKKRHIRRQLAITLCIASCSTYQLHSYKASYIVQLTMLLSLSYILVYAYITNHYYIQLQQLCYMSILFKPGMNISQWYMWIQYTVQEQILVRN